MRVSALARSTVIYNPESYAILSRARVVLQCSGTATVEAGLLGIPSVIAYRCRPLYYSVGRRLMRVKFIGMVNILLDEAVQPEFFQKDVDADHLADEVWSLLTNDARRRQIQARLAHLPEVLGPPGVMRRAAGAVMELVKRPGQESTRGRGRRDPERRSGVSQRARRGSQSTWLKARRNLPWRARSPWSREPRVGLGARLR